MNHRKKREATTNRILLGLAFLATAAAAADFDGATVVNIEKHTQNYGNCSGRSSDEYVWIRFKRSDGSLTGYYRLDTNPAVTFNSTLSMAMTALTAGTKVNVRTHDDNWCNNPGFIRALNLSAE